MVAIRGTVVGVQAAVVAIRGLRWSSGGRGWTSRDGRRSSDDRGCNSGEVRWSSGARGWNSRASLEFRQPWLEFAGFVGVQTPVVAIRVDFVGLHRGLVGVTVIKNANTILSCVSIFDL